MAATSMTLELAVDADLATLGTAGSERPTRINLVSDEEPQKHSSSRESLSSSPMQQHLAASPTTPTSATLSPSGSATAMSPSSSSSSFLPEMPQWKKDLIQRRKTNAAKSEAIGGGAQSPLLSPQQRFSAGHETDGFPSPTRDLTIKSVQYTAKISSSATSASATATTTQTTSQQQQFSSTSATKTQQQYITAEEQQLQQQRIAKTNVNAIKTPATHTQTTTTKPQQCEEDVDPVISPTTKEEAAAAEKFIIGGHSTPQVNSSRSSSSSMDPSDLAGPVAEVAAETAATITTTTNKITAPIPKQRSLLVAPTKLLSTKEPDSCTNSSSATAAAPSTTRLTSSSSPTIKNRVEKVETDEELHEVAAEKVEAEEKTSPITTKTTTRRNQHTVKSKCGTYSSSTSTSTSAQSPHTPTGIVGKLTASATLLCSPLHQSYSSNESDKSFTVTTPFGNSALLSNTTSTTTTAAASKKLLDIEKLEKSNQSSKISTKLQSNQFIKNQTATVASGTAAATKYIKYRTVTQEQSSTAACNTTGSPTKKKTTATAAANKKKMVAVQEMKKTSTNHHIIGTAASANTTTTCGRQSQQSQQQSANHGSNNASDLDACEDLSYGPGIVSKLRCRYLSLALRESMEKQRHALDTLRRATSLNNLLDRDEQHKHAGEEEDDDDVDDHNVEDDFGEDQENLPPRPAVGSGILRSTHEHQLQHNVTKKTATFQKYASASNAHARMSQSQNDFAPVDNNFRSRHIKRGNDSLKRARSVEALLCEKSPWNFAYNRSSLEPSKQLPPSPNRGSSSTVTIEDKIHNARERLVLGTDSMPPRRLTSIIDDTERPPPDLVKQTLKKFEATANRRGRGVNRAQGNGEVANKVANYRSIIKEQKPAIVFPKPPLSPTKKAAIKHASRPIALVAADLIGSPIGRKTAAAAATTTPVIGSPLSGFSPIVAETSTPKQKLPTSPTAALDLTPTLSLVAESGTCLSDNSPDIIPRHSNKLLSEIAAADFAIDSPVTALTKKLEQLRIDADKAGKLAKQHVISKEFQTKPNQQQQQQQQQQAGTASSIEFVGGDAADKTDKHHNSNGTRSNENKNNADDASDNDKNTNDDDDVDDFDDRCVEAESVKAGTGSASSDLSDDEYGTTATTKRVSKTALENIAKAGTSQQFIFASNQQQKSITESLTTTATGKQIGIIRPLHQLPTTSSCSTSSASSVASNESFASRQTSSNNQQHMETLKSHQQQTHTVSHSNTNARTHTHQHHHHPPALTSREIEKNRINEMKKTATAVTNAAGTDASATAAPASAATTTTATTSLDTVIVTGGSSGSSSKASGLSELDAAATITHNSSPLWALQTKKKRQPPAVVAENNSMVFNFSNRKEVPDYIENDGVVIRRKRELPKPNESGFVLLGDLSLETSTDSDYDDFSVCPPSPCDVEFENAHIVIDGKSSIRQKPKEATFRVQFNDTLTSTFEYPSEASLVVDDSMSDRYTSENFMNAYENLVLEPAITTTDSPKHHHHVAVDEIIPLPTHTTGSTNNSSPTSKMLGSLPLGSAPLGFYTPIKAPIDNLFQLGVTRAPNGNGLSHNTNTTTTTNGTTTAPTTNGGNNITDSGLTSNANDEPESLQYLKPANDDLTIAYSEGAQKTDLLY